VTVSEPGWRLGRHSKQVHLYDTQLAVIIIFTVIHSAFGTYLLSSVYANFPTALLDAAAVDGAGKWRTLWRVVVPVSRPTLSVLLTYFFIWIWNKFFLPLIFTRGIMAGSVK
jgi:raffinose/stachyose/melibiose transport system permease protein